MICPLGQALSYDRWSLSYSTWYGSITGYRKTNVIGESKPHNKKMDEDTGF